MNELITVNTEDMTVSARDLHDALEATERFSAWFERFSNGFVEGEDFTGVNKFTVVNNGAQIQIQDYACTVEMAKHICLMSRTEKGKQCRQYLINLEKAWNDPMQIMARALKVADKTIAQLTAKADRLEIENKEMQPKALFADAVSASDSSILVRELAKILKQNGCDMGEKRLYKWLREHGYIIKGTTQPTQRAMEMGLFEIIERSVQRADMSPLVTSTTKVTGKGQQYFINKLLQ